MSQDTTYHMKLADKLKDQIYAQSSYISQNSINVDIIPKNMNSPGAWTILLLLPVIKAKIKADWIVFCSETIQIHLKYLLNILSEHNCRKSQFLGYPAFDTAPTSVHHFSRTRIAYPLSIGAFAIKMDLIKKLHLDNMNISNFFIDPHYELAEVLSHKGIRMTAELRFCSDNQVVCAFRPVETYKCHPAKLDELFFAVKTFRENHSTRANLLRRMWIPYCRNYLFFSDYQDESLPSIDTGVPNSVTGHCNKTISILRYLRGASLSHMKWYILTDDDTILSVQRMSETLGCFTSEKKPVMIGRRYGFGYGSGKRGYDYITGGGGIAMNSAAVSLLSKCVCPTADTPDDMWLGACAQQNGVTVIHSEGFHQARPNDYPLEYLKAIEPVSFHKIDILNPFSTYRNWFEKKDSHKSDEIIKICKNNELNSTRDEL